MVDKESAADFHVIAQFMMMAAQAHVTEGYAADWTIGQLRDPAQQVADRIERLMNASAARGAVAASSDGCPAARTAAAE